MGAGTAAGFVALRYHAADKLGEIYMIAVDPDFQRRGIALDLTDFAVERMKEARMTIAMVETGGDPGHGPARRVRESWIRLVPCRPLLQETVGQDHEPQSP